MGKGGKTSKSSGGAAAAGQWQGQGWYEDGWGGWGQGAGNSKGQSGKGKGKNNEVADEDETGQYQNTNRIRTNYQYSKALLRATADKNGSCFVRNPKDKRSDLDMLSTSELEKELDASNTHLIRRPGIGVSETMGTLHHGLRLLEAISEDGGSFDLAKMKNLLTPIKDAIEELNLGQTGSIPSADELEVELGKVIDHLQEHTGELDELLPKFVMVTSRLYHTGVHLQLFRACLRKIKRWGKKVPEATSESKSFKKWLKEPGDAQKMRKAICEMLIEAKEKRDAYENSGNLDPKTLLSKKTKRKPSSSSSGENEDGAKANRKKRNPSESSSNASEHMKKRKKLNKKSKTARKTKKSPAHSSASSESDHKTPKKGKKEHRKEKRKEDEQEKNIEVGEKPTDDDKITFKEEENAETKVAEKTQKAEEADEAEDAEESVEADD